MKNVGQTVMPGKDGKRQPITTVTGNSDAFKNAAKRQVAPGTKPGYAVVEHNGQRSLMKPGVDFTVDPNTNDISIKKYGPFIPYQPSKKKGRG